VRGAPRDASQDEDHTEGKAAKAAKTAKETAPRTVRRSSAELHFTETTIIRGEAAPAGEALPSGATHEIAGHDAAGQPILKRKRFSIC
jgi:hypothetical protein